MVLKVKLVDTFDSTDFYVSTHDKYTQICQDLSLQTSQLIQNCKQMKDVGAPCQSKEERDRLLMSIKMNLPGNNPAVL